ncbi:2-oxo-4-hydroxy-4-carboxy-5-ureidoimidazoline decarboxylase [Subtercola sp. PAMC28395]|uniref:2-oxo-4-hydroxy-4-carboxy-5-ureidoimidazoline decarboxylase n=1 Tax=Subtercola sp. PAMC28395 TaxID=2846775 RepID=UPI001C0B11F4|nr:2-oxo-4-hydroxy-4-carboxy-5-ureidoimidazoline decarboxylase [Subtercola sp. PAMC28395]QWT22794.1 2-oxo-4-hydroxy-4-carboxy-5-ureidoimidazoline decarboxylase [Subtercola sp. PAMC28395]
MLNLPPDELRALLRSCLNVDRWVDDVSAAAPYDSEEQFLEVASMSATPLTESEIDEALADHPRIGEKHAGQGAAQAFSKSEQSSADAEDAEVNAAVARGNAVYEQRFGRVFLVRAKGRSRAEILGELTRRLELDPETEVGIVASELRDITMLRLRAVAGELAAESSPSQGMQSQEMQSQEMQK